MQLGQMNWCSLQGHCQLNVDCRPSNRFDDPDSTVAENIEFLPNGEGKKPRFTDVSMCSICRELSTESISQIETEWYLTVLMLSFSCCSSAFVILFCFSCSSVSFPLLVWGEDLFWHVSLQFGQCHYGQWDIGIGLRYGQYWHTAFLVSEIPSLLS